MPNIRQRGMESLSDLAVSVDILTEAFFEQHYEFVERPLGTLQLAFKFSHAVVEITGLLPLIAYLALLN